MSVNVVMVVRLCSGIGHTHAMHMVSCAPDVCIVEAYTANHVDFIK